MDSMADGSGQVNGGGARSRAGGGIGCGVFLIIVGLGLFAERMGWFPFSMVWFLPAAFVAWGIAEIYKAVRGR
jgi:hypothetical protein